MLGGGHYTEIQVTSVHMQCVHCYTNHRSSIKLLFNTTHKISKTLCNIKIRN